MGSHADAHDHSEEASSCRADGVLGRGLQREGGLAHGKYKKFWAGIYKNYQGSR
jgi:hypothetical protein